MNSAASLGATVSLIASLAVTGAPTATVVATAASSAADDGFAWPGSTNVELRDLASLDRTQRLRAVERLIRRDGTDPEILRLLVPLLTDTDPQVRGMAARALARRGAPEAIDAATRWVGSPAPAERPLGLEVLREATHPLPPAARRAIERSLADSDAGVRLLAIDALSRHDLAPSFPTIAAALDDEHREIRLRAIRLLERSRDPRAPLALLGRLGDADRQVRLDAIQTLGALGDTRAVPALTRELVEGSDDVRIAAVGALGRLKAPAAVSVLAPLARRRPLDDVGRQAQLALGEIATPPALAVLMERLREPPVAEQTREAFRRAGAAAVAPLLGELAEGGASSRSAAATLLGEIGDRRATAALTDVLQRRTSASPAALTALAALKDPAAVVALVRGAGDPSAENRRLCFQALIAIADRRAAVILPRGLGDPDPAVRQSALQLAARLGATEVAAAVVARLGDPDESVRREATSTLIALDARPHPSGTVTALLGAIRLGSGATGPRVAADRAALGDALEAAATEADAALLAAAARDAVGPARVPIVRGLIAAFSRRPIEDAALIDRLFDMLSEAGPVAGAAADALTLARPSDDRTVTLLRVFDEAEPSVRARLCAAMAAGGAREAIARLDVAIQDEAESDTVRAAAIWMTAAAGAAASPQRRAVLERLVAGGRPPLAANARAAVAAAATPMPRTTARQGSRMTWVGVRLLTPTGAPLAHHWLAARAPGGPWVWSRTGDDGMTRIWALGDGPIEINATDATSVSYRRWQGVE